MYAKFKKEKKKKEKALLCKGLRTICFEEAGNLVLFR